MKPFKKNPIKLCCAVLAVFALLAPASCNKTEKTHTENDNKLKVTVTFNALAEMARAVGGDYADITTLVPDGMEVHDFELKVQDMEALSSADLFIYNGFGLESWVPNAIESSQNAKLIAVDTSLNAEQIGNDPHLWLSPKGAQIQTRTIAIAFAKADPAHADAYGKTPTLLSPIWKISLRSIPEK